MIPRRYNPVAIKIQLLGKAGRVSGLDIPVVDGVFKRPMGNKAYLGDGTNPELSFDAQVRYTRSGEKNPTELGNAPLTDGHLTIRKSDYDLLTVIPDVGDLIIEIAGETVLYEIVETRPQGHLRSRVNLMYLFFERPKEKEGRP